MMHYQMNWILYNPHLQNPASCGPNLVHTCTVHSCVLWASSGPHMLCTLLRSVGHIWSTHALHTPACCGQHLVHTCTAQSCVLWATYGPHMHCTLLDARIRRLPVRCSSLYMRPVSCSLIKIRQPEPLNCWASKSAHTMLMVQHTTVEYRYQLRKPSV